MDSKYQPLLIEEKIYQYWEKNGHFTAKVNKDKKPFSIILPPPNANADLHMGHAMYVYEDIMIRFHKLIGDEVLWLPGADHAGIETQFVYEKHLKKQGKSRFDFDRETLFKDIWNFVEDNRGKMEKQLKRLGFALDWSRQKYTMDPEIIKIVYETFEKLFKADLVYRAKKLVNYCTYCGTSFSDLEVVYKERVDPLYYMKYGPFILATVRPETKFGDTAVAVHPDDKRYQQSIGKEIEVEGLIGKFKVKVVADTAVDPKFGTGVVKVTPAHDFDDYEISLRHNLPMKQVIDFDGRLNELTGKYQGMRVKAAREQVANDLKNKGWIIKVQEDYTHRVGTCYRCGRVLEPLPKEQWFIKVASLKKKAITLIESGKINIYPSRFKKILTQILDNFYDWNISRQIVWGIRIPAYKCKLKVQSEKLKVEEKWFVSIKKPDKCQICGECDFKQDEDTFDTWFSSAQWPFATLASCSNSKFKVQSSKLNNNVTIKQFNNDFFNYFYPTSVMETGYDIFRAWVSRMIMIGYFTTNQVPFKNVFGHGMVRDRKGQKMSKSKGNVTNPMMMADRYGADALRIALIFETKEGGDLSFAEEKVIGMRNFINKVWNIGRFIFMNLQVKSEKLKIKSLSEKSKVFQNLEKEFKEEKKEYFKYMKSYQFSKALGLIYEFLWHRFADYYIEQLKDKVINGNIEALELLRKIYFGNLKMLHPFAPFVTEAVWQVFNGKQNSILKDSATQFFNF